jgi:phosphoglycerate dehydrogenase-like enzyme
MMTVQVIVPWQSKPLFEKETGLEPVFYKLHNEPFLYKVRRKLNLIDPADVLIKRIEFTAPEDKICKAQALWLSPFVYLPTAQMDCLLDQLPELRWIYSQITGIEHLDQNSFRQRNIMVSNTGELSSSRVAEMALACIFSHAKRLPEHFAMQQKRGWKSLACSDINKQTVGIIGTGNIGNEISRLCTAVGMRVIGASRDPERILANHNSYDQVFRLEELTGLLQQADHIVVTLPLNDQTRGLIGWKFLEEMKNAASLINVTRGAIVDEDALCKALAQGNIGAAYIDVPAKIPLPRWSRMHKTPNLVLTHYSSANSVYLINDAFQQFISGLEKLEKGNQPANRVL